MTDGHAQVIRLIVLADAILGCPKVIEVSHHLHQLRELIVAEECKAMAGASLMRISTALQHVGSLHASDAEMRVNNARDVYTRRNEGVSVWVVPSTAIVASSPADKKPLFEPTRLSRITP